MVFTGGMPGPSDVGEWPGELRHCSQVRSSLVQGSGLFPGKSAAPVFNNKIELFE